MRYVRAIKVEADGYTFDSKREFERYRELRALCAAGEIDALEIHPRFELAVNGIKVGRYTADFRYWDLKLGRVVVEDVKSYLSAKRRDYVLRRKLVEAIYGIEVVEVNPDERRPKRVRWPVHLTKR